MSKTYGEMISDLVDRICKFDDRAAVMRRNDIPKGHFYNVINPNRSTSSGNPYYTPVEWMVKLTRDLKDYGMLKKVVKDCGCICVSPDEIKELQTCDSEIAINTIRKIIGIINKA